MALHEELLDIEEMITEVRELENELLADMKKRLDSVESRLAAEARAVGQGLPAVSFGQKPVHAQDLRQALLQAFEEKKRELNAQHIEFDVNRVVPKIDRGIMAARNVNTDIRAAIMGDLRGGVLFIEDIAFREEERAEMMGRGLKVIGNVVFSP